MRAFLRESGHDALHVDVAPLPGTRQLVGEAQLRAPARQIVPGGEPGRREEKRAGEVSPREPRGERPRGRETQQAMIGQRLRLLQHGGAGHEEGGEEAHGERAAGRGRGR